MIKAHLKASQVLYFQSELWTGLMVEVVHVRKAHTVTVS